jgi:DNA-directed RNA polymerase subunit beta
MTKNLQPIMSDALTRRNSIRDKTVKGLTTLFPIDARNYRLEVKNVYVDTKDYSSNQQKEALMRGRTLHEPVLGTLILKDKKTDKILSQEKDYTLAHLPYFTERHTFIVGGNEYSVPSQLRLKSGVYTRERANGEFEAAFNLSKGANFRLSMEPDTGRMHMELGTSKIPLYSLLRALSVPDGDIRKYWGSELRDVNSHLADEKEDSLLTKIVNKIKRVGDVVPTTIEGKKAFIHAYFDATEMDPEVTQRTLGTPVAKASPLALLIASKRLLQVHKGEAEADDRDSLEFKTIHAVDDFFQERLDIHARRTIARKLEQRLNRAATTDISKLVPKSTFTKSLNTFITSSNLSTQPMQINPIEILDHAMKVTSLGEGGISSERAIPFESRKIHNTHLGILDPVRTPEGDKTGIDIRSALAAHKDEHGNLYTIMKNNRTNKVEFVSAQTLAKSTVAFPGQENDTHVDVIKGKYIVSIPKREVDYSVIDPAFMFSPTAALVPFLDGIQGNRAIMGSKFQTQALPLLAREAPLVQAQGLRKGLSMEQEAAFRMVPTAPGAGVVTKVDADYIYLKLDKPLSPKTGAESDIIKIPYDTNYPLASKTYTHNDVTVQKGDRVTNNQQLATSNFTKDGRSALGKNLSVAYMAYYGKNSNDAVVISEGAAKKLTSEHMYKEVLTKGADVLQGKNKFLVYYGNQYTGAQLDKLDANGIAKPGEKFHFEDPVLLALQKAPLTKEALIRGDFHKSLIKPYRNATVTWDHLTEGTVIDIADAPKQTMITLKTEEPMKIGDKLANRFGGKGVVSEIISNERMIKDESGEPLDVLFTSAGVVSRVNPAQIVEASLGKVAYKTGKAIVVPQFMAEDNVQYAKRLLKEHGVKDKETVYDPISEQHIHNIFVGRSYIHKLFKSTDTNYSAHGVTAYDVNMQPVRGGEEGAKGLGQMEINALLAHNARNNLKEMMTVKSEKSDEYWRAVEFGLPAPALKTPFVTEKFVMTLKGAGVNLQKNGAFLGLSALTDKDIKKLSSGALTLPDLEKSRALGLNAKNLMPEKGGLFDINITGGTGGTRWSHFELAEPIVNPVFEEPVRRLLGLTLNELRAKISETGGKGIREALNKIDLDRKEKDLLAEIKTARSSRLDNAVKQLSYIRAARKTGNDKLGDYYIWSMVPVVPPIVRPITPSARGGELQINDANYFYRDVALASQALHGHLHETKLPEEIQKGRLHLYDAVSALVGMGDPVSPQLQNRGTPAKGFIRQITGMGSPKSGFFHKKILKRQQDLSGRATATPDNTLDMDQVGVPEELLWTTHAKFIMKGLINHGYAPLTARDMIENRAPAARVILENDLKTRPIFINRAPSLHKHNMIAAYAVPVEGKSLRINPFIEQGQNLDYDGDAMQLHVPSSDKAVKEAQGMTLSNLLFSDRHRDALLVFPQHEAILGAYIATNKVEAGAVKKFKTAADAAKAYRTGQISANTAVKIG